MSVSALLKWLLTPILEGAREQGKKEIECGDREREGEIEGQREETKTVWGAGFLFLFFYTVLVGAIYSFEHFLVLKYRT